MIAETGTLVSRYTVNNLRHWQPVVEVGSKGLKILRSPVRSRLCPLIYDDCNEVGFQRVSISDSMSMAPAQMKMRGKHSDHCVCPVCNYVGGHFAYCQCPHCKKVGGHFD